ncbi:hypothetical protein FT663_03036 [Candidozyma haemuli var. vulneris]|nr:hypothetical protein FT662_04433 [[Candida] haemuloni var. vulneris]KAF3990770.1 hypothetical protein FT663_03036 [[Candida] haemuloni var. vulneris]
MDEPTHKKSTLSSSEVAFPRGGASVLTPLEMKTISNKATEDVLFEQAKGSKRSASDAIEAPKKKKKSKKKKSQDDEKDSDEKETEIEHFSHKNLIPGASILGQIVRVDKMDLTVAIGDNLFGQVPITQISSEITEMIEKYENAMEDSSDDESDDENQTQGVSLKNELPKLKNIFSIGQWVRAVVIPNEENAKRISLSIDPATVNASVEEDDLTPGNFLQASVKSVEDHGVVLTTGVENFGGFISKKELKKAEIGLSSLKPGQVVLASIVSLSSRTITMRPGSNEQVNKKTVVSVISSIDAVHPGTVVNAIITEINDAGVGARLFGMVDASFSLPHTEEYTVEKLKNHFAIGGTVRARVIGTVFSEGAKKFVLSKSSRVLSLQPTLNKEPLEAFPIGFIFDEGIEVAGADKDYIYVNAGSFIGQVHKSNVDPDLDIKQHYNVGSKHKARVLGFNEIDNILILTFKPKAIESQFVSTDDIPVGEFVSAAEVTNILPDAKGIVVKVFGDFEAFVPPTHISDAKLMFPERKFRNGGKVKARILATAGKKLYATLRKSLVNMEEDTIVKNLDDLSVGFKTTGVVEKFIGSGVLISFFGNLKAYLPKNEISETFVENAKDYLKEGQAVNVRILNFNKEDGKITVTLRQSTELTNNQMRHLEDVEVGRTIATAFVVEKTKEAVIIELEGSNLRGVIVTEHLSDGNYEENRKVYKALDVGQKTEVLILEKDFRARTVIATSKQSLLNAAKVGLFPASYEDIHTGTVIPGFVKSVTNMGIFVSFGGRLTGLVLAKNASSDPTVDLSAKFHKNQSVACNVIRTDDVNKRFYLSFSGVDETGFSKLNLKNPLDSTKKTASDYSVGSMTKGKVASVEPGYVNVQLADNLYGRLEASQVFNKWKSIKDKKAPLSSYKEGQNIKAKIIGYYDQAAKRYSPSSTFTTSTVVELSILPETLAEGGLYKPPTFDDLKVNSEHTVFVESYEHGVANVSMAPGAQGQIPLYCLSNDTSLYEDFESSFPVGCAIRAKISGLDYEHHRIEFSAREKAPQSIEDLKEGERYPAKVFKIGPNFVLVELAKGVVGYAYVTDALNDYDDKLEEIYKVNSAALAKVEQVDVKEGKVYVSLRNEAIAKDKPVNSIDEIKRGDVAKGFINSIGRNGLYVSLGRTIFALVRVTDISDAYLADWKKFFKPHQCVSGKISQCKTEGRILMTLKESEVNGDLSTFKTFEELEVGENYDGSVRKVADFGVFIKLDGTSNISGLCHRSEIADTPVENVVALFGEGDRVKVKILKIDNDKKQLSLGMKASYFTTEADDESMSAAEDEEDEVMGDAFNEDDDEDEDEDSSESDNEETEAAAPAGLSGLSSNGFDWTASILDQAEDDESSSDDEEDFTETHKRRKKKGKNQVKDRTAEMNATAPESVSDFERMLVGNPDSSVLWMNYMSFQLQLGEIEKSREIAERALKTINYREEQEKMNIWIAILNLENSFGSDESLDEAFKRATQYIDSLTMHQKLIGIYVLSEKFDKADDLHKAIVKKFSKDPSVWVQYGSFLMDREESERAHETLARALQALPKKDHIEVVRKFAQLEFAKGDAEQGRSLFEGLVTDAPKRIDLWNVYIDQEIKNDNKDHAEDLFRRVTQVKLSRKQAKFFFAKWLKYEEEKGNEQSVALVKALAVEYVQAHSKDDEE